MDRPRRRDGQQRYNDGRDLRNPSAVLRIAPLCDMPRRNDLDGRGTLSGEALAEFTRFFLSVCIDQVDFMESLVQPERLRARILLCSEEEARLGTLPAKSGAILEAVLYRGERLRQPARRLAFPATLAARWMPGLFPDWPTRDLSSG